MTLNHVPYIMGKNFRENFPTQNSQKKTNNKHNKTNGRPGHCKVVRDLEFLIIEKKYLRLKMSKKNYRELTWPLKSNTKISGRTVDFIQYIFF